MPTRRAGAGMDRDDAEAILRSAPYHQFLDARFAAYEPGRVVVEVPFREELLVNPEHDIVHGGVLGALLDIAGHYSVLSEVGARVPTADLRVDYLRPARTADLRAEGQLVRRGSNLAVADAEVSQPDVGDDPVAIGRGSYGLSHVD